MSNGFYLVHVSGSFYGRGAGGAFCATCEPSEIHYWATREAAEENRQYQAEGGYSFRVEEASDAATPEEPEARFEMENLGKAYRLKDFFKRRGHHAIVIAKTVFVFGNPVDIAGDKDDFDCSDWENGA